MAAMTSRERVQAVLHGELPDRVPYVEFIVDFPLLCRLLDREVPTGRYFDSAEYMSAPLDLQTALNELVGRDNLTYNVQPPIPATKAPGRDQILFFEEGHLKTWADLDRLVLPDLDSEEVRGPIRELLAQRGDYAAVLSTRVGISATYLAMGMEHFYLTLKDDPGLVTAVLSRYADWSARAVHLAREMGFDFVFTADDIAGNVGLLWSPALFREIFWPQVRKVAAAVREAQIPWILHSDGDLDQVMPNLVGFGITGLHPLEPTCMDIREIRAAYPKLVLAGNVDVDLLARGTPAQVRETVRGLIRDIAPGGRYFVSSGNSVASYCDVHNVLAMGRAIQEFGQYPIAA